MFGIDNDDFMYAYGAAEDDNEELRYENERLQKQLKKLAGERKLATETEARRQHELRRRQALQNEAVARKHAARTCRCGNPRLPMHNLCPACERHENLFDSWNK